MNTRRTVIATFLAIALVSWATTASAQNAIGVGGRTSITANFALISANPDIGGKTDNIVVGASIAYTTESARFEIGGGVNILGLFADGFDLGVYTISGEGRINTNALGPDENILLYAGAIAGVSIIDIDAGPGLSFTDEVFVVGPKIGGEFYITPNTAIQLQDAFLVDSEGGTTNNLTIGFKFVFE